jgi:hypothetical protein
MKKIRYWSDAETSLAPLSRIKTLLAVLASFAIVLLASCASPTHTGHQAMIHEMGHRVMPFELSKTQHIFEMTDNGGVQQVIVKDPSDKEQIALIQEHLQHLATEFRAGDFSTPVSLHGADMPGLKELAAGAARVKIEYAALPNGGQITFTTDDLHLVTAIHRWFGAQLSDHGADATYR